MIKSKLYFWVECDHEGCAARCPAESDETQAWVEPWQARDVAKDSDWFEPQVGELEPVRQYCPDHAPEVQA